MDQATNMTQVVIKPEGLAALFEALLKRDYRLIGPTVRDQTIVYEPLDSPDQLPAGWDDQQDNGRYRLVKREDRALFAYVVGPHSWKQYLLAQRQRLFTANLSQGEMKIREEKPEVPRFAFIGVRPCELAAISIQDHVFTGEPFADLYYQARRQDNFIVAVNCAEPGGTCFCASMGTGPRASSGYDLAITELMSSEHRLLITAGSGEGEAVLGELPGRPANEGDLAAAAELSQQAAAKMGRTLSTAGLRENLRASYDNPRWKNIAERCLSCANCTMVCPTCFCSTVEDKTDLAGNTAERFRVWDSCFTNEFTYIHGGSVRDSTRVRYRQWLTHKLCTWIDQFGTFGCVGCGRCITWCPVGIDITAEAAAIAAASAPGILHQPTTIQGKVEP